MADQTVKLEETQMRHIVAALLTAAIIQTDKSYAKPDAAATLYKRVRRSIQEKGLSSAEAPGEPAV
jgi:hypothetical protein